MREFIEHIKLYNRKQGLSETGEKLKTKVESHRIGIFLNIYNRKNKTRYSISKKQESPDFLARDSEKYISLEHLGFRKIKRLLMRTLSIVWKLKGKGRIFGLK